MSRRSLWKVAVTTSPEAEDAVTELLAAAFQQPVASYTDVETRRTAVATYLSQRPDWSQEMRASLRAGLERISACALNVGPGRISLAKVRWEDWAESWKRHFKPITVGSRLLIKPSWSRRQPERGQAVVVLDPGLSFGTGQHPTTAFCLQQVVKRRRASETQSVLDIGTGSGILALAATKLGYAPVDAFDLDPEAVRIARTNARQNRLTDRIRFYRQDLTKMPRRPARRYSVICANLISTILLSERERILARLRAAGVLIVAGILKQEFSRVQAAYEAAGLRMLASHSQNEWRSAAFGK
jgi:ribosomal protein L11 methyltransferase